MAALRSIVMAAAVLAVALAGAAVAQQPDDQGAWGLYRDERLGFSLRFPAHVLKPAEETPGANPSNRILVSDDGRVRLIVSAGLLDRRESLATYRAFLLSEVYGGANVTWAPVEDDWFVVSGYRAAEIFYERVSLVCGGRAIASWALSYPVAERGVYGRVVEGIARSFASRPGASCR